MNSYNLYIIYDSKMGISRQFTLRIFYIELRLFHNGLIWFNAKFKDFGGIMYDFRRIES